MFLYAASGTTSATATAEGPLLGRSLLLLPAAGERGLVLSATWQQRGGPALQVRPLGPALAAALGSGTSGVWPLLSGIYGCLGVRRIGEGA